MVGIASVDVNSIRASAIEMGNLLSSALENNMSEVNALLSMQSQLSMSMQTINSLADNISGMGEKLNISA